MSMIIFLGLNFEVQISDEDNIEESLLVLYSSGEEGLAIRKNILTTPFIYEVDFNYAYHIIWDMTEYNEQYSPHNFIKAKVTFNTFCEYLKMLIPKGDFCEFYYCWIGEEEDPVVDRLTVNLNEVVNDQIYIDEKMYIKFINEK